MAWLIHVALGLVACLFPLWVGLALVRWLPMRIPDAPPADVTDSMRELRLGTLGDGPFAQPSPFLTLGAAIALAAGQFLLFWIAGQDDGVFATRITNQWQLALLPGVFLAFVAPLPIHFRMLERRLGPRLVDVLDVKSGGRYRTTLRKEVARFPITLKIIVVVFTVLNLAAFNTFFIVTPSEIHYSPVVDPMSYRQPIAEITELAIYTHLRAPNGQLLNRRWLQIRSRAGGRIDTDYLIDEEQIPEVIKAVQQSPAFHGKVTVIEDIADLYRD